MSGGDSTHSQQSPGWSATKDEKWSPPSQPSPPSSPSSSSSSLLDPSLDAASEWLPSSPTLLRHLSPSWLVNPLSSEPGVYLLQRRESPGCLLLLQDLCYVFMVGSTPLHSPHTGIWFAQDLPGVQGEGSGVQGGGGGGVEGGRKRRSVFTRDLSRLDLSRDVCNVYSSGGGEQGEARAPDLTLLDSLATRRYGRLVSQRQLVQYIDGSSEQSRGRYLEEGAPVEPITAGLVTRGGASSPGQFGGGVLALAELAQSWRGGDEEGLELFFPAEEEGVSNRSTWTHSVSRLLFGSNTKLTAGRVEGAPVCFRNVLFSLNAHPANGSAAILKRRSYAAVGLLREDQERKKGKNKQWKGRGRRRGTEEENKEEHEWSWELPKLELRDSEEGMKMDAWVQESHRRRKMGKNWGSWGGGAGRRGDLGHITVVEDERGGLANVRELVKLLERNFYGVKVDVVRLGTLELVQQIHIMENTMLLVSLYNPSLSNIIFMPEGSAVIALFPFKFYSEEYRRIAVQSNVRYFFWENKHIGKSRYTDDCMIEQGFARLTKQECWSQSECLSCVRDKSVTTIAIPELDEFLVGVKPVVTSFIENRKQALV